MIADALLDDDDSKDQDPTVRTQTVRVFVTAMAYHNDILRRPGTSFDMELAIKRDKHGDEYYDLPSWCEIDCELQHKLLAKREDDKTQQFLAGVKHTSGDRFATGETRGYAFSDAIEIAAQREAEANLAKINAGLTARGCLPLTMAEYLEGQRSP